MAMKTEYLMQLADVFPVACMRQRFYTRQTAALRLVGQSVLRSSVEVNAGIFFI